MHTLWLASWYPNRTDPFNGDFVQRHALSLATRGPLTVIHVAKEGRAARAAGRTAPRDAAATPGAGRAADTLTRRGNLTERISYVRDPGARRSFWNKLVSQVRVFRAYDRAFRAHRRENGRPDLLHVHVCMNAGVFALWAQWRWGIPFVVTEHYSIYVPGSPDDFYSRPFLYRYVNRMILRRARAVHSVSRFLLERMSAVAPLRATVVVPNAVDTTLFRAGLAAVGAAGAATGAAPFRFIHVSGFQPLKNVPGILDAFALLASRRRDWELVLIGPAGEDIRAYAASKDLGGHLHWTGEVSYAVVAEWLRSAGALVHFSWVENQPCVISEALCCGVPVVAAAVGGIPEVVRPGGDPAAGNGILVPSKDVQALAQALQQMMDNTYDRAGLARAAAAIYAYEAVGEALAAFEAKATHS